MYNGNFLKKINLKCHEELAEFNVFAIDISLPGFNNLSNCGDISILGGIEKFFNHSSVKIITKIKQSKKFIQLKIIVTNFKLNELY